MHCLRPGTYFTSSWSSQKGDSYLVTTSIEQTQNMEITETKYGIKLNLKTQGLT